jgi:hypothetical protein
MYILLVVLSLITGYPAPIRNAGHCSDVTSPVCPVRAWWPRQYQDQVGTEAYWWATDNNRVCFVTLKQYQQFGIGQSGDCLWRDRPLDAR